MTDRYTEYRPSAYSNHNNIENTNAPPHFHYRGNASALGPQGGVHNNMNSHPTKRNYSRSLFTK